MSSYCPRLLRGSVTLTRWATTSLVWTRTLTGVSFVASPTSTRIWRVAKAAGREFPRLVEDDVLDYLITEAVYLKAAAQDEEFRKQAEEEAQREQWKKEAQEHLKHYQGG